MSVNPIALTIRAKKLGVLLCDARLAAGKSLQECAQVIGVTVEMYQAYELGDKSPSLPELEALAYSLKVPIEHFWGTETISGGDRNHQSSDLKQLVLLRQRKIGALLRQARLEAGFTLEELAEKAWSGTTLLETYELGEAPVPLPDLEILCGVLNRDIKDFRDQNGPVGRWSNQQRAIQEFMALDPELQAFVCKPINRPYLELAQRLSEMSVEKLRAVAEGLLEITL